MKTRKRADFFFFLLLSISWLIQEQAARITCLFLLLVSSPPPPDLKQRAFYQDLFFKISWKYSAFEAINILMLLLSLRVMSKISRLVTSQYSSNNNAIHSTTSVRSRAYVIISHLCRTRYKFYIKVTPVRFLVPDYSTANKKYVDSV